MNVDKKFTDIIKDMREDDKEYQEFLRLKHKFEEK